MTQKKIIASSTNTLLYINNPVLSHLGRKLHLQLRVATKIHDGYACLLDKKILVNEKSLNKSISFQKLKFPFADGQYY